MCVCEREKPVWKLKVKPREALSGWSGHPGLSPCQPPLLPASRTLPNAHPSQKCVGTLIPHACRHMRRETTLWFQSSVSNCDLDLHGSDL